MSSSSSRLTQVAGIYRDRRVQSSHLQPAASLDPYAHRPRESGRSILRGTIERIQQRYPPMIHLVNTTARVVCSLGRSILVSPLGMAARCRCATWRPFRPHRIPRSKDQSSVRWDKNANTEEESFTAPRAASCIVRASIFVVCGLAGTEAAFPESQTLSLTSRGLRVESEGSHSILVSVLRRSRKRDLLSLSHPI